MTSSASRFSMVTLSSREHSHSVNSSFALRSFFGIPPPKSIAERTVHHAGKGHFTQRPNSPRPLYRLKELRILQDMSGMGVHIPAVQSLFNLLFQVTIIDFSHPIEVRYIHANIVYNLAISRTLGKQYCSTAAESLCIKFMTWDQRQNMFKEGLLASVVRNRRFHYSIFLIVTIFVASPRMKAKKATRRSPRLYCPRLCGVSHFVSTW